MKLRSKLIVSFTAVTLILVLLLFLVLRWSFGRGAEAYILQQDRAELEAYGEALSRWYSIHPSWEPLSDRNQWHAWLEQNDPDPNSGSRGPGPEFQPGDSRPPSGPPDGRGPNGPGGGPPDNGAGPVKPYFLLSPDGNLLAGERREIGMQFPIKDPAEKLQAYLALPPPPSRLTGFWNNPLVNQSFEILLLLSVCGLLLSILAAVIFSSRWVGRLLALHAHVGVLAQGEYGRQMPVDGRDEIAELSLQLNELSLRLQSSRDQRKQLTADISHELRTPLANLRAGLEAMQDGLLPADGKGLEALLGQVLRLNQLVEDLYQLSLADAGVLTCHREPLDLSVLVSAVISDYRLRIEEAGLSIEWVIDRENRYDVLGDKGRLTQLLTNLLENSLRYTDAPGKISVSISKRDNEVILVVEDSAPGVASEYFTHLTDRLFRVDKSRNRVSGGAGLGLNLCLAIAKMHQGDLQITASSLGGIAVTFSLELAP